VHDSLYNVFRQTWTQSTSVEKELCNDFTINAFVRHCYELYGYN